MKRSAKKGRPAWMLPGLALVTMPVVGASLVLVWARVETVELGYLLAEEAERHQRLVEQRQALQVEVGALQAPERLRRLAEQAEMAPPTRSIQLPEPADLRVRPVSEDDRAGTERGTR